MQQIENSQTMGLPYVYINKFRRKDDLILQRFKMETMLKYRALWSHIDGSNVKPLENDIFLHTSRRKEFFLIS
jgi:hypothetical protein